MKLPRSPKLVLPDRVPRPVLIGTGVLVICLIGAGMAVPHMMDGTRQGRALATQLAAATGQQVRIEGPVTVSLFPRPHIAITNLRLLSLDGRQALLSAPRVDVNAGLLSLLSGNYSANQIRLVQPTINLSVAATLSLPALSALQIDSIAIDEGTLNLGHGGRQEAISGISGSIHLPSAATLLRGDLTGSWRQAPIQLSFDLSSPISKTVGSVGYLKADIGASEASLSLTGNFDLFSTSPKIDAELEIKAGQAAGLWALASSLGLAGVAPNDAALRQALSLSGHVAGTAEAVSFPALTLQLGAWAATGQARYTFGPNAGLSLALKADALDLAQWPSLAAFTQTRQFTLGANWLGAFDIRCAGLVNGAFTTGPIALKGSLSRSTLKIETATIQLPGEAQAQFIGALTAQGSAPTLIDGTISAQSLRLRETLQGLGLSPATGLDDAALRQASLKASVRGSWPRPSITAIEGNLDGVTLRGQMAARANEGLYDASFTLDQLDLDRYAADFTAPGWLWTLPAANVNLTIRQMRAGGRSAENVTLSAQTGDNLLTIRSLSAADFGGNAVQVSGTLAPSDEQNSDLLLRLTTPDYAQLRQSFPPAARLLPEVLSQALSGAMDVSLRIRRGGGVFQQYSSVITGDGRIDVVKSERPDQPSGFKLRIQNRETAGLLRLIAPSLPVGMMTRLGPTDIYAEGTAQPTGEWQLTSVQGQVAGSVVRSGTLMLRPGTTPVVTGSLAVSALDADQWQRAFDGVAPALPLAASLDMTVDRLTVQGQALSQVSGQVRLTPPGSLAFSNLAGGWQGGRITLNAEASYRPSYALKGSLDVREANVLLSGGSRFGLSGMMDLSVRLDGQGSDMASLWRSFSGDGEFSMDSGSFRGMDFAALTEALQNRQQRATVGIDALLARGGETALSSFGGDFMIDEGQLRIPQLRLRTPSASIDGQVAMDLALMRVDVQSDISLRELSGAPAIHMAMAGLPTALEARFEASALARHLQMGTGPAAVMAAIPAQPDESTNGASGVKSASSKGTSPSTVQVHNETPEDTVKISGTSGLSLPEPQEPVPPALAQFDAAPTTPDAAQDAEAIAAVPPASAADLAAVEPAQIRHAPAGRDSAERLSRQMADMPRTTTSAARRPVRPAPDLTAQAAPLDGERPLSIDELLSAMPALQDQAAAAVAEARNPAAGGSVSRAMRRPDRSATSSAGMDTSIASGFGAAATSAAKAADTPTGPREVRTKGLTIRLPNAPADGDEDESSKAYVPAANVSDLMNRIEGN